MSDIRDANVSDLNLIAGLRSSIWRARYLLKNPDFFVPDGIWLYCGAQGTGKTLSMVRCAARLKDLYPGVRVVSNLELKGIDYVPFVRPEQLIEEDNGISGVLFVLDEMQVIFNSLESRDIPISIIGEFAQNRKKRRVILGSSQVYSRVAKPVREQLKYVVSCQCLFGCLQVNVLADPTRSQEHEGKLSAERLGTQVFFHRVEDYMRYDTYKTIVRSDFHG